MKKIDTVHPSHFEFGMAVYPQRLAVLKVHGVKGEQISIPMDPDEAVKLSIALGGFAHAVRRAAAQSDSNFDSDLDQLADMLN